MGCRGAPTGRQHPPRNRNHRSNEPYLPPMTINSYDWLSMNGPSGATPVTNTRVHPEVVVDGGACSGADTRPTSVSPNNHGKGAPYVAADLTYTENVYVCPAVAGTSYVYRPELT